MKILDGAIKTGQVVGQLMGRVQDSVLGDGDVRLITARLRRGETHLALADLLSIMYAKRMVIAEDTEDQLWALTEAGDHADFLAPYVKQLSNLTVETVAVAGTDAMVGVAITGQLAECQALTDDMIALVRENGDGALADKLQVMSCIDAPPLLLAICALSELGITAPREFELRLRFLNHNHDFDDELDELVESQATLQEMAW